MLHTYSTSIPTESSSYPCTFIDMPCLVVSCSLTADNPEHAPLLYCEPNAIFFTYGVLSNIPRVQTAWHQSVAKQAAAHRIAPASCVGATAVRKSWIEPLIPCRSDNDAPGTDVSDVLQKLATLVSEPRTELNCCALVLPCTGGIGEAVM